MSTRDIAVQGTRTVVKAHASEAGALLDSQVINGHKAGRQALPYAAVFMTDHATKFGHDEVEVDENGGSPRYRIKGQRVGRVEVHGFGDGSEEWLENVVLSLADEAAHRDMDAAGVTLNYLEPVRAAWRQRNANMEEHYILPLRAAFRVTGPWKTAVALALASIDAELSSGGPVSATLALDIDVDLP